MKKEASLRDRICNDDRAHWSDAVNGALDAMESVAGTIRCRQVLNDAQKDILQRRDLEAAIARMKAAAAGLGTLTDGRTAEGRDRVGRDDAVWKFQMTDADTVEVQLDDGAGNLGAELRDSSWKIIAGSRQTGPALNGIETANRLNPGTYYIRIIPADGKRGAAYALRVAKGHIDTAGQSVATARDLGSLGPGVLTIHEHIGGIDRGDIFRFTASERTLLTLTVGDVTSDVHLDLLDRSAQPVRSSSFGPDRERRNVEWVVEPRSTYYIAVTPAGRSTSYSLGIALSAVVPASYPSKDKAASLSVGAAPVLYTLPANENNYWGKFSVSEVKGTRVSIVLVWSDPKNSLRLHLENERGVIPFLPNDGQIVSTLAPGTYWVHVSRAGGTGAVPLHLNLTRPLN